MKFLTRTQEALIQFPAIQEGQLHGKWMDKPEHSLKREMAAEMGQQLRTCAAFPEDLCLVTSTHIRWPLSPVTLSSHLGTCKCGIHPQRHTHINKNNPPKRSQHFFNTKVSSETRGNYLNSESMISKNKLHTSNTQHLHSKGEESEHSEERADQSTTKSQWGKHQIRQLHIWHLVLTMESPGLHRP